MSESEQHSNIYSRRQKQFIELFVSFFCVCCGFFSFIRGLWYHSPGTQHIIPYGIVHIHTDIRTCVCMCLYICISSSKVLGCHVCSEVLGLLRRVCCVMFSFYHEIKIDRAHKCDHSHIQTYTQNIYVSSLVCNP